MKAIIGLIIAGIIFIAGCTQIDVPQGCSTELKSCNNGAMVGRNPSRNCEFDSCPSVITDVSQCAGESKITCPDGSQYQRWNVVDGKCFEINYFRDPCGELPGGRVMQITPEICEQAGGNWNECGSTCAGTGADFCIEMCQAQCECGGIAGFTCPAGYECRLSGKIADEMGVCIPNVNV